MKLFAILVVCLAAFCGGAQAAKVLALLEKLAVKETHSIFFKQLADAGLEVTYKIADDPNIMIKKDDKHLYDHLVIFSPTLEELGGFSVVDIEEFIDDGGNVLTAGSSRGGGVITDHKNLLVDILTGCSFSYSHNSEDPITEYPHATGRLWMLTGSGSVEHGVPSGTCNEDLAKAISAWCSQMAGVDRIDSFQHHLASSISNQSYMKQEKHSIFIAHYGKVIAFATVFFLLDTLNRESRRRIFFLHPWILILFISCFASLLFFSFLIDTSNIPVPKLVAIGAILIISGLHLLLPSPSSRSPRSLLPSSPCPLPEVHHHPHHRDDNHRSRSRNFWDCCVQYHRVPRLCRSFSWD